MDEIEIELVDWTCLQCGEWNQAERQVSGDRPCCAECGHPGPGWPFG